MAMDALRAPSPTWPWHAPTTVRSASTACPRKIRQERAKYYSTLEYMQKGTLDITTWMQWFLDCLGRAIEGSQTILASVLNKARFWETVGQTSLNDRERPGFQSVLDGFEGKLTTSKYAS